MNFEISILRYCIFIIILRLSIEKLNENSNKSEPINLNIFTKENTENLVNIRENISNKKDFFTNDLSEFLNFFTRQNVKQVVFLPDIFFIFLYGLFR